MYIAKATNSQYFTIIVIYSLTNVFLSLISWLKHLDNHKTYYFVTPVTSVMGSGFIWEPWELADW